MTALTTKNKQNETLILDKNQVKATVAKLKQSLKKADQEIKANRIEIREITKRLNEMETDKKMALKERDYHFKKAKELEVKLESKRGTNESRESHLLVNKRMSTKNLMSSKNVSLPKDFEVKNMKSNKKLLDVEVNKDLPKSAMGSSESLDGYNSSRVIEIPVGKDVETQTPGITELFQSLKENCISREIQVNFEKETKEVKMQTISKLKAMKGVQTESEVQVPSLNIMGNLKNYESTTYDQPNTQRTMIPNEMSITPRDQILTQGKNSASRSLGLDDSLQVSEVQFNRDGMHRNISETHDNYLNGKISFTKKNKPLVVLNPNLTVERVNQKDLFENKHKSQTNYSNKRAESLRARRIKNRLVSPIQEENPHSNTRLLANYFKSRKDLENPNFRNRDFEQTSSHFQNILTSKYESTMDNFFDSRKRNFSKLLKPKEGRNLFTSPTKEVPENTTIYNESPMNTTFNSINTKFVVKPRIKHDFRIEGKRAIKNLIKGAKSRDI